jgi:hypothetical protein
MKEIDFMFLEISCQPRGEGFWFLTLGSSLGLRILATSMSKYRMILGSGTLMLAELPHTV